MKHTVCEFWPSSTIERHSSEEVILEKAIERGSKLGQGQVHDQTLKELNFTVETCVFPFAVNYQGTYVGFGKLPWLRLFKKLTIYKKCNLNLSTEN